MRPSYNLHHAHHHIGVGNLAQVLHAINHGVEHAQSAIDIALKQDRYLSHLLLVLINF